MSDLDWKKHDADITGFVKRVTNFYLRTKADSDELLKPNQGILLRNNYATPRLISELLEYLGEVSAQVNSKLAVIRGLCIQGGMDFETCKAGSTTYGPILQDYADWHARLEIYESETAAAMERDPNASGDEDERFWNHVTKPLLTGLYPGKPLQSRLDAVAPLIMAWQIEVAEEAFVHAREHFWTDLKEQASIVYERATGFGGTLILLAIAGLALGYGYGKGK
jgi:hypothetical protein